jgi:hypothetical protein
MFFSYGFLKCRLLNEVIFAPDCHLKQIDGFRECISLSRIEIPSLVEVISEYGFWECISLNEVLFASDCHLKQIDGFRECTSLVRIEIPSSVEIISGHGFSACISLNEVLFASDYHLHIGVVLWVSLYRAAFLDDLVAVLQ